jgi:hypothetical protein
VPPKKRKTSAEKPGLMEEFLEFRAGKKRKRRTPARVLARALVKKKGRGGRLAILAAVLVVVAYLLGPYAAWAGLGVVAFLVLCEAWPELTRWGWQNRRMLAPFAAILAMTLPAALVLRSPRAAAFAGILGLLFVGYAHLNLRLRARDHSHAHGFIPRQWIPWAYAAAGWTALAAKAGLTYPVTGVLLAAWLAWAVRFWMVNRTRTGGHQIPLARRWEATIASPDYEDIPSTDKLLKSRLVNVRTVPGGYAARVVLPPGMRGSKIEDKTEVIAGIYDVPVTAVTVEQVPGGSATARELLILPKSPINKPCKWKGSDLDPARGISTLGNYIDSGRAEYVWYRPGSGPWHDLIAGTTDAGKSRLVDLLLASSRLAHGLIVDWVGDPQFGQSLPAWQGEVDWFARGNTEIMVMLRAVKRVMLARNDILSQIEWTNPRGKKMKGVDHFTPTVEMPLLVVTIEEASFLLKNKEARAICEEIAKMGRKCGIKLRLITQVASLDQLGGSGALRSNVVSGNVIVLRTGGKSDKDFSFQGAMTVDPVSIPRLLPDGSTSAGMGFSLGAASRSAPMRVDYVPDPFAYIKDRDPVWRIDAASAEAAGAPYAARHSDSGVAVEDIVVDELGVDEDESTQADVVPIRRGEASLVKPGEIARGAGGVGCKEFITRYVKAYANRSLYPDASVSRGQVLNKVQSAEEGPWSWETARKDIAALVRDPRKPIWSDDEMDTLYYKEAS